ncbi:MAG: MFS transporter [Hyphomicrobium sp.]|jgi:DHA2 family multidrug resistance protein-like MFS transporter|uniref:MFS transporter n=1 Tax=Hyphomicrobium sp. TaxID=82 RepID=UPI0025C3014F|nr:MFS transporter [Hyphomicrobium sp.]MBX9862508.1 MFS transporter [Hyphomicrobium sp.]
MHGSENAGQNGLPGSTDAKATRRDWIGLAVLALPCILYSMDLTVLHLAVPQIASALKPSSSALLWIVDIYGFMVAGTLITMGTLGDRIGRRRLLLIGAAAFGLTSLLAAFSTSSEMLIVARALQGLAAATLAPSTLSLIRNMFHDPGERAFAIGVWVACFSAGAAVGPLVGGAILAHYWWGAVFIINVPIMLLLLAVGPLLLPEFRDPNAAPMDLLSAAQSLVAVLAIIFGMKWTAEAGWGVVPASAIGIGLVVGVLFFRRQVKLVHPLIDVGLFKVRGFNAALLTNILSLFVIFGTFLFIAQYLQLVLGMGPLEAGIWTAPSGVVFAVGSMAAPWLAQRFPPHRVIASGFLISAVGFLLITQLHGVTGAWPMFAGMIIFCLGLSPIGAITTDMVMAEAPPERAGEASSISETSFEFGGALGIAVLGSVVTAVYRSVMAEGMPSGLAPEHMDAAQDTLGGAIEVAGQIGGEAGARLMETSREAFVKAFEIAAGVSAVTALFAAIVAATILKSVKR